MARNFKDGQLDRKMVSTLLTMINLLSNEQRIFIKDSIMVNRQVPAAYEEIINGNYKDIETEKKEYAKIYGYIWVTNGTENRKIVEAIEPIPVGFRKGFTSSRS